MSKNENIQTLKEPKQYENLKFVANDYCANSVIRIKKLQNLSKGVL